MLGTARDSDRISWKTSACWPSPRPGGKGIERSTIERIDDSGRGTSEVVSLAI
jgi:hypothetical protein